MIRLISNEYNLLKSWFNWLLSQGMAYNTPAIISIFPIQVTKNFQTVLITILKNIHVALQNSTESVEACRRHWYSSSIFSNCNLSFHWLYFSNLKLKVFFYCWRLSCYMTLKALSDLNTLIPYSHHSQALSVLLYSSLNIKNRMLMDFKIHIHRMELNIKFPWKKKTTADGTRTFHENSHLKASCSI